MRKYWTLTRVLLKDTGSMLEGHFRTKSKATTTALWVLLAIGLLPMMLMLYFMFVSVYALFAPLGQLAFITGVMFNMACIVIFVLAAFSTPAVFYFSKEVEYLLPLPLSPVQIIAAKFTLSLLFEYIIALFLLLPLFAAYVPHIHPLGLTLQTILVFLTLPVLPLVYSVTIVMVLMRLSKFGRNRDRYNMVVSLIALAFGLGISLYSRQLGQVDADEIMALINGNQTVFLTLRTLFPTNAFAAAAVTQLDIVAQFWNILITAAILLVFLLLAKFLYFKGLVGISETTSPAKKMSREKILRDAKSQSVFLAYLRKEFRLLFRSPTALLNCVIIVFLMPLFLVIPFVTQLSGSGSMDINAIVAQVHFDNPQIVAYILAGAAGMGFLVSAMNLVTATAISREGRNCFVMKYIPVPYRTQLNAKIMSGVLVSFAGLAMIFAVMQMVFRAPWLICVGAVLLSLPGCVIVNSFGLLIDVMRPMLVWDSEQQAVKQNMNALFLMLGGMLMAALVTIPGMIFFKTPGIAFCVLLAVEIIAMVGGQYLIMRVAQQRMAQLNV